SVPGIPDKVNIMDSHGRRQAVTARPAGRRRRRAHPRFPEARMSTRPRIRALIGLAPLFLASCTTGENDMTRPPAGGKTAAAAPDAAARASGAALAPGKKKPAPPDPTTPDAMVVRAEQVAGTGALDEASRLLEKALALEPDHRGALFLLAQVAAARGDELDRSARGPLYRQAAAAVRKLRANHKDLSTQERELIPRLIYNEACTFALKGQSEKALDGLAEAVDAGLDDPEIVTGDDDLASIRQTP